RLLLGVPARPDPRSAVRTMVVLPGTAIMHSSAAAQPRAERARQSARWARGVLARDQERHIHVAVPPDREQQRAIDGHRATNSVTATRIGRQRQSPAASSEVALPSTACHGPITVWGTGIETPSSAACSASSPRGGAAAGWTSCYRP